jgi:hypothetical protein
VDHQAVEAGGELGDVALEHRAVPGSRGGHVELLAPEEVARAHRLARLGHRAQQHRAAPVMDADLEQAPAHVLLALRRVEQREQRRGVGGEPARDAVRALGDAPCLRGVHDAQGSSPAGGLEAPPPGY